MRSLALLVALLASIPATWARPPRPPKSAIEEGRIRADWAVRQLKRRFKVQELQELTPFNNGASSLVLGAKDSAGHAVVVRQVSDVDQAVNLQNAFFKLAHQIRAGKLVRPAAVITARVREGEKALKNGQSVMITGHAGEGFVAANKANREWEKRIPEDVRLQAAFLDCLTKQQDRIRKNFMENEAGEVTLIDHDFSQGHLNKWKHPSIFYPGQALAFSSKPESQKSFDDLPREMQDVVNHILDSRPDRLAHEYRLAPLELEALRTQAGRIKALGLSGAISEMGEQGQRPLLLHGGKMQSHEGFVRDGEIMKAIRGQSPISHMVYGPYLKFAPGHYEILYQLRSPAPAGRMAKLEVHDAVSHRILASRDVTAADLRSGEWNELTLPVEVPPGDNRLEFRVEWRGTADLEVHEINVR